MPVTVVVTVTVIVAVTVVVVVVVPVAAMLVIVVVRVRVVVAVSVGHRGRAGPSMDRIGARVRALLRPRNWVGPGGASLRAAGDAPAPLRDAPPEHSGKQGTMDEGELNAPAFGSARARAR